VIIRVTQEHAKLFNNYEKEGTNKQYPSLYCLITILDNIALGYNKVWDQKYEEAITEFSMIDLLPMKKQDQPLVKTKLFSQL
jgi:hypothetical protein